MGRRRGREEERRPHTSVDEVPVSRELEKDVAHDELVSTCDASPALSGRYPLVTLLSAHVIHQNTREMLHYRPKFLDLRKRTV